MLPGADGRTPLRLSKNDARLSALGTIDELSAAIGLCVSEIGRSKSRRMAAMLGRLQEELFRIGAMLVAVSVGGEPAVRVEPAAVTRMEKQIDAVSERLEELKHFVVPGGCELAARLHMARTLARRAERDVVTALHVSQHLQPGTEGAGLAVKYLNRLSDLLFALARQANRDADQGDTLWKP